MQLIMCVVWYRLIKSPKVRVILRGISPDFPPFLWSVVRHASFLRDFKDTMFQQTIELTPGRFPYRQQCNVALNQG